MANECVSRTARGQRTAATATAASTPIARGRKKRQPVNMLQSQGDAVTPGAEENGMSEIQDAGIPQEHVE